MTRQQWRVVWIDRDVPPVLEKIERFDADDTSAAALLAGDLVEDDAYDSFGTAKAAALAAAIDGRERAAAVVRDLRALRASDCSRRLPPPVHPPPADQPNPGEQQHDR